MIRLHSVSERLNTKQFHERLFWKSVISMSIVLVNLQIFRSLFRWKPWAICSQVYSFDKTMEWVIFYPFNFLLVFMCVCSLSILHVYSSVGACDLTVWRGIPAVCRWHSGSMAAGRGEGAIVRAGHRLHVRHCAGRVDTEPGLVYRRPASGTVRRNG